MNVTLQDINSVTPYDKNPRKNDHAVDKVAESIKAYGFQQPIVVDRDGVVIVGHTRLKAAQKLGIKQVPVHVATDLTPEQVKAYRIADNKTGEFSEWDKILLKEEVTELQTLGYGIEWTGFTLEELEEMGEEKKDDDNFYTRKIKAPVYQITGECPAVSDLYDDTKASQLIAAIEKTENLPEDVKTFLVKAAQRHTVFSFSKIAEFYAHATPAVQRLMEQSALVIIDFNSAVENGYVKMIKQFALQYAQENGNA